MNTSQLDGYPITRILSEQHWVRTRIGCGVAAGVLMVGIAIGSAAFAGATKEWDIGKFDDCIASWPADKEAYGEEYNRFRKDCCVWSGGQWSGSPDGTGFCTAPAPEAENVPQPPAQTTTPPVLQNPPRQPSNPLTSTPRGPNSGTIG